MLQDTPEMDKQSKRSSALLENFGDLGESGYPPTGEKNGQERQISAFIRQDNGKKAASNGSIDQSPAHSLNSQNSRPGSRPGSTGMKPSPDRPSPSEKPPRASFMSSGGIRTDSNSPGHTVARADIRASAEKILYTFVLPGSEREIILPETILNKIIRAIEEEGRDDPEVFDDAKDYVFQAMERDAFPGFLQAKALGNLVPLSIIIRLALGLAAFGSGFWGGYYMILRNVPKHIRCLVSYFDFGVCESMLTPHSQLIIPFTIGAYCLVSYQYKLDIVAAYAGFSEYTFMNWSRVREPFVRKLLMTRATMALIFFAAVAVAFSVLFIFVPGLNF